MNGTPTIAQITELLTRLLEAEYEAGVAAGRMAAKDNLDAYIAERVDNNDLVAANTIERAKNRL